jgi:malonyl-CoA O-methyltransferase
MAELRDASVKDGHVIDRLAARRSFSAASADYDRVAVLQTEVRTRLLERLDIVKLTPAVVLDLGCGTGVASRRCSTAIHRRRSLPWTRPSAWVQQAAHHYSFVQKLLRKGFARVCADAIDCQSRMLRSI